MQTINKKLTSDNLIGKMTLKMTKYPKKNIQKKLLSRKNCSLKGEWIGSRSFGPFNQGFSFPGRRHTYIKKVGNQERFDLMVHCCTLCLEVLGMAVGHHVVEHPWIKNKTWKRIVEENQNSEEKE